MSIVNVYITTKYVTNIKTTLAVTVVDRLASLGETTTPITNTATSHIFKK